MFAGFVLQGSYSHQQDEFLDQASKCCLRYAYFFYPEAKGYQDVKIDFRISENWKFFFKLQIKNCMFWNFQKSATGTCSQPMAHIRMFRGSIFRHCIFNDSMTRWVEILDVFPLVTTNMEGPSCHASYSRPVDFIAYSYLSNRAHA